MRFLKKIIKDIWYSYLALKYLIEQEKMAKSKVSINKKIWCWLHGFSSSKYGLYSLNTNDYRLYLSDYKRRKTSKINGIYSLLLDDKAIFSRLFENEGFTAKVYGRINNKYINIDGANVTFESFLDFLNTKKNLIIKKYKGGGGKGVYRLAINNGEYFWNDTLVSKKELHNEINKLSNYLIVEHLNQANYSNRIYAGTINSIRIITMKDPKTNKVFIPVAVHKFGSEKTKPVDNVWNGGMTALIDVDSGKLGPSLYHYQGNNKVTWMESHPDTNVYIEGTTVPNWNYIKESVVKITETLEHIYYVGWDVVATNDGFKIIEGNNFSDVNILQVHHPLLKSERVKQFYEHHQIL